MAENTDWGPGNPHPLSKVKTELVWEGKYDEYGNRREVEIAGCDLPLQKVEAIDEPFTRAEGAGQLDLFKKQSRRMDDFRNMLIWGDNKLVMAGLLRDFKGKIDLIYIDPPFDVGADFTASIPLGEENDTLDKDQSILEMVAYRDIWGKGTDSYVHMLYERVLLMRDLLSEKGSIFVHLDWRVSGYARLLLDELLGRGAAGDGMSGFRNEVIWCYSGGGIPRNEMPRKHETIFWYTKTGAWNYQPVFRPYSEGTLQRGRTAVKGPDAKLRSEGTPVNDWWPDVKRITSPTDPEKLYFDTQKSEDLLARILTMCSREGDIVADFFCGSGTTGAVAEKLGRRWIMCDLGRFAIHTTRKRIIEIQRKLYAEEKPYRAFDVYNLGRYERQWWQKERLLGADEEHRKIVLAFYRAEPLSGASSPLLHGRKGPAFVHVDEIDSILTVAELKPVVEAAQAAGAKEVHCLAWEFETEIKRNAEAFEHEHGVKVRLIRIPREVMEKNRRPGVDSVPFFEMATLEAEPVVKIEAGERIADVKLMNFLPSLSEVPSKELDVLKERAVKSGFDFIDFWAIDFDHQEGQPFKHHWQDYRLRKDRSLKTKSDCRYAYKDTRAHTICVKVIDVFGCDTSIFLTVPGANGKRGGKK